MINRHENNLTRRGNILTLSAFLMVVLLMMVAFTVDIGHVCVVKGELQRTADAAAMAGVWELVPPNPMNSDAHDKTYQARSAAIAYAASNQISKVPANVVAGDIEVGYVANPYQPGSSMSLTKPELNNAVQVSVRKTAQLNGEIPFFFARVLGFDSMASAATATAVFVGDGVRGFRPPLAGGNIPIIPFAVDQALWDSVVAEGSSDTLTHDPSSGSVTVGSDGVPEFNLYPQVTGFPEHNGTLNIGHDQNTTQGLKDQILDGVTPQDFTYHGESLEFDKSLTLLLDADPGISGGVESAFKQIIGETRIVPVFGDIKGKGNNGQYLIVKWVGVRIMEVNLSGSDGLGKRVIVQPGPVLTEGVIPSGDPTTSDFVYSNVWLTGSYVPSGSTWVSDER